MMLILALVLGACAGVILYGLAVVGRIEPLDVLPADGSDGL